MKNQQGAPEKDPAKDSRNRGHNGNPAQSAGRVTAREQDENPEPINDDPNDGDSGAAPADRARDSSGGRVEGDPRTPAGENI